MRIIAVLLLSMFCCGCSVQPLGFAPWVIVMPGARVNLVVGKKTEDRRVIYQTNASSESGVSVEPEDVSKADELNKVNFAPPKMVK